MSWVRFQCKSKTFQIYETFILKFYRFCASHFLRRTFRLFDEFTFCFIAALVLTGDFAKVASTDHSRLTASLRRYIRNMNHLKKFILLARRHRFDSPKTLSTPLLSELHSVYFYGARNGPYSHASKCLRSFLSPYHTRGRWINRTSLGRKRDAYNEALLRTDQVFLIVS